MPARLPLQCMCMGMEHAQVSSVRYVVLNGFGDGVQVWLFRQKQCYHHIHIIVDA
jgi:hypothetical protein